MSNALYNNTDIDEIFIKHFVRSKAVLDRAKELGIKGEDFLTSTLAGIRIYKHIVDLIFEINETPIDRKIVELGLGKKKDEGLLDKDDLQQIGPLLDWCYSSEALNEDYCCTHLLPFMRYRRFSKAVDSFKDDPIQAYAELHKEALTITDKRVATDAKFASPFMSAMYSELSEGILTGFPKVDEVMEGLGREECGLLVGHSGTGKTAVASAMSLYAAHTGRKVLYISLEEPMRGVVNRWYASELNLNYTRLHHGRSEIKNELIAAFDLMPAESKKILVENLQIVDARGLTPISYSEIKTLIDMKAGQGFIPDMVIIDQMDYMRPEKLLPKGAAKWQEFEQIAFECDKLSQYLIKGQTFALWVIHQSKGQMQWTFGYDEISGFKGIVKPFDVAMGIGRYSRDTPYINLFSLKVRHTQHFEQSYNALFENMKFIQKSWAPPEDDKKKRKRNG